MKAALYVRVSTEEQAKEGYSIEAQKAFLMDYCSLYGYELYGIYCDAGVSGSSIEKRLELKRMLGEAEKGKFNIVLVWKLSRLSRSLKDLLDIVDCLDKNDVSLVSCSESFDTSTPSGRMTLQILGSIGEFERSSTIENVKLAMESRARKGHWNGGNTPFGYRYDVKSKKIVVDDCEAEIVKKIFELYKMGIGYFSICRQLNSSGHRTREGMDFTSGAVKRILTNRAYCGLLVYNKYSYKKVNGVKKRIRNKNEIVKEGVFPPIINKEEFDYIQEIIRQKRDVSPKSGSYILTGLLRCPQCGGAMVGSTTTRGSKKYRYYKCSSYNQSGGVKCSVNSVNADFIEQEVLSKALEYIHKPKVINDILSKMKQIDEGLGKKLDGRKAAKKIKANENKKKRVLELLLNGVIDEKVYRDKVHEIELENRNLLKASKEEASNHLTDGLGFQDIDDAIGKLFQCKGSERGEIKKIIHALIDRIIINTDKSIGGIIYKFPL